MKLNEEIRQAEETLKKLYQKVENTRKLGKDSDYPIDSVIYFKRQYGASKLYSYCALKTPIGWYITGRDGTRYSWEQLINEHLSNATDIWYASEWSKL